MSHPGHPTVIPTLHDRDAAGAIDWPCDAFGFARHRVVPDANAHYARARAAGARLVYDIRDEDYGGRGYSCRDPAGHLWNFGTDDPWGS